MAFRKRNMLDPAGVPKHVITIQMYYVPRTHVNPQLTLFHHVYPCEIQFRNVLSRLLLFTLGYPLLLESMLCLNRTPLERIRVVISELRNLEKTIFSHTFHYLKPPPFMTLLRTHGRHCVPNFC